MAGQLMCNYPGCGKVVQDQAWITSCSHVYCEEHGLLEFAGTQRTNKCPLCFSDLANQLDIVKADINPSEQYKSMILAGQRPEVVLEMASRALALWHYQMQLQFSHEKQEKMTAERKAQEVAAKITQEKTTLELDLNNIRKDFEELQKKKSEVENSLEEKTRQNHKLTSQLDVLRCRLSDQDARQQREMQMERSSNCSPFTPRIGFLNTNPGMRQVAPRPQTPHGPVSGWNVAGGPGASNNNNNPNRNQGIGSVFSPFGNMPGGSTSNRPTHSGNLTDEFEGGNPTPAFILNF